MKKRCFPVTVKPVNFKTNKKSKGLKSRGLSKHIGVLPNNFDSEERKSSRGGRKASVQEQSRRRRHAKRRLEERESSRTTGQVEMPVIPRVRWRCLLPKFTDHKSKSCIRKLCFDKKGKGKAQKDDDNFVKRLIFSYYCRQAGTSPRRRLAGQCFKHFCERKGRRLAGKFVKEKLCYFDPKVLRSAVEHEVKKEGTESRQEKHEQAKQMGKGEGRAEGRRNTKESPKEKWFYK